MENFNLFLDYIARTNLFNFVIFFSIIVFLVRKMEVSAKLEVAQESLKESITASEAIKEESEERLSAVQKSSRSVKREINAILKKSEENALLVGNKILQDAENSALIIQENKDKVIENNRELLKNELIKRASLASVEIAKTHIINELNNNNELHDKFIDESVEAIVVDIEEKIEEV